MATDNPLLAGMLGGIELARATMGNQLAQQQATMQNVLQMQQMQLEAAQSRQLFEMRQVDMVAQTKLREMEIAARTQESAARVELAKIEAPIREKEFKARLLEAGTRSAVAESQLDELEIKSGAAQIKSGFFTRLTGVAPEAQPAFAQQFFSFQRQMYDALPPERRNPRAIQALGVVETEWRMEMQKRKDAAVGMVESLGSELEKLDGMDSAGTPYKMKLANLQARYNSVIRPSLLMAGVDTTQHDSVFNGAGSGKTAAEVAAGYMEGASSYAGDWRKLEQDPQGVAAGENTSLLESARMNADKLLRDFAGVQTNPEARRLMGTAGQLLDPVLNATRKGLTEPSWIGKAFGQGAAVDEQVSMVASPFGFGEVPATTRKVRSLTAGELAELSKAKDPRRVLDILTSAVVSVNEPEPQAPLQYIPGL